MLLLLLLPLLWEGSLSQTLEIQPLVTVQKGMCVHVPCAFDHDGLSSNDHNPLYGYWFKDVAYSYSDSLVATNGPSWRLEEGARERFHLLGDPSMKNCSLSITDAQFSDTGTYYFRFEKGKEKWSYKQKLLNLEVTDSPKLIQKPDIFIPEVLESGKRVTLSCTFPWTCGVNKPFTFSWMGAALPSKTQRPRSVSSKISFIPGPQHHGTNVTCWVTLPGGHFSSEKTIQLNVSYPVHNVSITMEQDNRTIETSPVLVVQEGRSLQLLCAANSHPPATLSWTLGDQTLASSKPTEDGTLALDLPHLGPADGGNYTCLAQHPLGSKQASLRVSVQYAPRMLSPSCSWIKETFSCTCSVQAEPAPSLHWCLGGKPVEGNSSSDTFQVITHRSGPWANSSLNVKVNKVPNTTISCEGKNPQGTHTLLFQMVPDEPTPSHVFPKALILGILCGAGATSLLALCLLLLVKMLRKRSAAARAAREEDPKRPSCGDLSLDPISPTTDTPKAPEGGLDELHYACLNFQGVNTREDHGSTHSFSEYAEIKFQ